MANDTIEEFFRRRGLEDSEADQAVRRWRNRLLLGGAFILETVDLSGILGPALALAQQIIEERARDADDTQAADILTRIEKLETAQPRGRRIRGLPLAILTATLEREAEAWMASLEADEAIALFLVAPNEYRDAATELEHLQLVRANPNLQHPSGIQRTRLADTGYLRAAPVVAPELDAEGETARILVQLGKSATTHWYIQAPALLEATRVPVARFDLVMRALGAYGIVRGTHTGDPRWGSRMTYEVTPHGRRVIRGDEPLEALL